MPAVGKKWHGKSQTGTVRRIRRIEVGIQHGGAAGALTGVAIGGYRHGGVDALIGGAAGAVAGGLIGNTMDREQQMRLKATSPETYARVDQGQPLSVADVKALALDWRTFLARSLWLAPRTGLLAVRRPT